MTECTQVQFPFKARFSRRVVAKAEQIEGKENPCYVVTSLGADAWPAQRLYERLYCARGEMENRIKEQLHLFSDRLSTETLRSNQPRLYFSALPMCWSTRCSASPCAEPNGRRRRSKPSG